MRPPSPSVLLAACVLPLAATATASAAQIDIDAVRASKRATAVRISEPIRVDGILEEPAWDQAEPALDFYQRLPAEFEPATRRTVVRFVYDATTLYVGAMLYDPVPDRLITNDLTRDFRVSDGDAFGVILDTFQDRRNAYGFMTNPGGAQRDTLAYDNGRRNDANWHGIWFARTAIHPDGWSVEYAIPFKTLRFPARDVQEWGLNLLRIARRDYEAMTWSPVPRHFSHYNVAYAGTLEGIAGVEPGRNLRVKPFATGQIGQNAPGDGTWSGDADGGFDLKWGITPALVLDGTYRTDFSQVEADTQQINLTRFGLFFPEKREFFLESPASFQVGLVETVREQPQPDLVPFFSRRIGLSSAGQPIPVHGGLRLTGQAGGQGIGFLTMQTEPFEGAPGDNFTAARVTRPVSEAATIGGFYFGRESSGTAYFNRVAGLDLRLTPRRGIEVEAFAMRSSTEGQAADWLGRAGFRLDGTAHQARFGVLHVGDAFQHDLGFVRRRGIGRLFGRYNRILRPANRASRVQEHWLGGDFEATGDDSYSRLLTGIGRVTYRLRFADGGELNAWARGRFERLDEPFDIREDVTIPVGDYQFEDVAVSYLSNRSAPLSGSVDVGAGGFWTGRQRLVKGTVRLRLSAHVAASATLSRSVVDLPEGSFNASIVGLRLDWSFTPRMFLNAFIQHNTETDTWVSNVRYNLIHRPLSDIFVVWNETRSPSETRRALLLKYTHLIAF